MRRIGVLALSLGVVWPALAASPPARTGAAAMCQRGDALFRLADFDQAAASYRAACELDPAAARAWLGLGRIASLEFRRTAAREHFTRAFDLDPADPEIR